MAPECMKTTLDANEKSDVWSCGVVMWEIFSFGKCNQMLNTFTLYYDWYCKSTRQYSCLRCVKSHCNVFKQRHLIIYYLMSLQFCQRLRVIRLGT